MTKNPSTTMCEYLKICQSLIFHVGFSYILELSFFLIRQKWLHEILFGVKSRVISKGVIIMPKRGENIRKRKDGRWEGRYICGYDPVLGRSKYKSVYGRTYKEVKDKMDEAKYKYSLGEICSNPTKTHFGKYVHEWFASKKQTLKLSSQNKYLQLIEKHILPELGHIKTCDITEQLLIAFLADQKKGGNLNKEEGLSDSSIKTIIYILRSTIIYCQKHGYINKNIYIGSTFHVDKKNETDVLSTEEQLALDNYFAENPSEKNLGIMFGLYCGLRIGEICALKWADIDLPVGTVCIHQTVQRTRNTDEKAGSKTKLYIDTPKSISSQRIIPLPTFFQKYIMTYYPLTEPTAYVMNNSKEAPLDPRTMQYHFKKVLQITGISDTNFHTLRHTFATECILLGFDIKTLSKILGHANVNITLNKYVHPSMDQMKDQMNYWNSKKGHLYGQNT